MTELHDLSALEQAAAVHAREVSPVELVEHYLSRIERLDAGVGGFITVTADAARAEAAAATQAVLDGSDLPALHGVPTGVKDLNLTAGVRTTFGSLLMADFVPDVDDNVVVKMREAGLISLGKTNTPEFGFPCYTAPQVAPPARTPWDPTRLANGSSGGAAAAVSSGLLPIAQGSDGGGSIRSPASACGLVGLKTSRGRISTGPLRADFTGLGVLGPLARTVRDAAAFLDATSGYCLGDPTWAPPPPAGETFLSYCDRRSGPLRIGRHIDPVVPGAVVEDEVRAAWEDACRVLESLGHHVEDAPPPLRPEDVASFVDVWTLGATTLPVPPEAVGLLEPLTAYLREEGLKLDGQQAMLALAAMGATARATIEAWSAYDVVVSPVCTLLPRPLGWFTDGRTPAEDFEAQKQYSAFTAIINVTGQPALSLPLAWSRDGLPIGIMLVGRPADEATLLALGAALEEAAPWRQRTPPVWHR